MVTLCVNGKPIDFLCDTGACRTTCKESFPRAKSSNSSIAVRAADGKLTHVEESEPVWLRDPQGQSCQISVLMFPECPVNLLGRDALFLLGLALVPTSQGRIEVKRKAELTQEDIFVLKGSGLPYYYYSLDVPNKPPHGTATALMTEGRQVISRPQDKMEEGNLHVTLWFKITPGPDTEYEAKLDRATPVKITIDYIYSDAENTAVAGVIIPDNLKPLNRLWLPSHISLYKNENLQWKDLGKLVQQAKAATDWTATSVNTWTSASTGLTKKALFWSVQVQKGVHLRGASVKN